MPCVLKHGRTGLPKCRSIYVPSSLRFIPIAIRGSGWPRGDSLWAVNLSHSFHGHLQITLLTHDDPSQHTQTDPFNVKMSKNIQPESLALLRILVHTKIAEHSQAPILKDGSRKKHHFTARRMPKMNRALPHSTPTQTLQGAACVLEYICAVYNMIESITEKGRMEPRMSIASGHGLAVDQGLPSPADSDQDFDSCRPNSANDCGDDASASRNAGTRLYNSSEIYISVVTPAIRTISHHQTSCSWNITLADSGHQLYSLFNPFLALPFHSIDHHA